MDIHYKFNLLDKVINSKIFSDSGKCKSVLVFMVERSIDGLSISESLIAKEVFGVDNVTEDVIDQVRETIQKIDKLLKHYYSTEGNFETTCISIPAGYLAVKFTPHIKKPSFATHFFQKYLLRVLVVVSIFTVIVLGVKNHWLISDLHKYQQLSKDNVIWNGILDSENRKTIQCSIQEPRKSDLFVTADLVKLFVTTGHKYQISDKVSENNDVIWIGSIAEYGRNTDTNYLYNSETMKFYDATIDSTLIFTKLKSVDSLVTDYCLVTKETSDKRSYLSFAGIGECANIGAIEYFTTRVYMNELTRVLRKKYGEVPPNFQVVLQVKGLDEKSLVAEPVYIVKR